MGDLPEDVAKALAQYDKREALTKEQMSAVSDRIKLTEKALDASSFREEVVVICLGGNQLAWTEYQTEKYEDWWRLVYHEAGEPALPLMETKIEVRRAIVKGGHLDELLTEIAKKARKALE